MGNKRYTDYECRLKVGQLNLIKIKDVPYNILVFPDIQLSWYPATGTQKAGCPTFLFAKKERFFWFLLPKFLFFLIKYRYL